MHIPRDNVVILGEDRALRRVLRERLEQLEDHAVDLYELDTPYDGLASLPALQPDLLLLRLAGYTALDVLVDVRTYTKAPLIALIDSTIDGVDAIEAGADDYLRLPCPAREIAAKVRGALRRRRWDERGEATLRFGSLTISTEARELLICGQSVPMPQREFDLLRHLAESPRRVFTRVELLESVWDASTEWLGPATVTEHVRRIRQRLLRATGDEHWIRTVRGVGYRFDPPDCDRRSEVTNAMDRPVPRAAAG